MSVFLTEIKHFYLFNSEQSAAKKTTAFKRVARELSKGAGGFARCHRYKCDPRLPSTRKHSAIFEKSDRLGHIYVVSLNSAQYRPAQQA